MPADLLDLRLLACAFGVVVGLAALEPSARARSPRVLLAARVVGIVALVLGALVLGTGVGVEDPVPLTSGTTTVEGGAAVVAAIGPDLRVETSGWRGREDVAAIVCRTGPPIDGPVAFEEIEAWFGSQCDLGGLVEGRAARDGTTALTVPRPGEPCDRHGACTVLVVDPRSLTRAQTGRVP